MKIYEGQPLGLGVSRVGEQYYFAVEAATDSVCNLLLWDSKSDKKEKLEMTMRLGAVCYLEVRITDGAHTYYCYEIDGVMVRDPYGRDYHSEDANFSSVSPSSYDWEGDTCLWLDEHEIIAYSLHVRGFTKNRNSGVKAKGTFLGITEKIPYLLELGVNQIQCMPVYAFYDSEAYTNYWGYGEGDFFALKERYAFGKNATKEFKDMVKACHKAGIEVVLTMPFSEETDFSLMMDCLRYYVAEFHVDGFVVNPCVLHPDVLKKDPVLRYTKILTLKDDYQNDMRRFLRGDEGVVPAAMWQIRARAADRGGYNYITTHTGFTLQDVVSYEQKHNEENGEFNQDGPDENYSWNCGEEGPTRKRYVLNLRERQLKNAFALLLLSQGTPCILAGDEFGNSQNGNNNVYCQDNTVGWLNWKKSERKKRLTEYVKELIALRKRYPILHRKDALLGADEASCGLPDISFHGKRAWQIDEEYGCRQFGVYYHMEDAEDGDVYVAYNMHWNSHTLALPNLKKKKWCRVFSTAAEDSFEEVLLTEDRQIEIKDRTIEVYVGR